MSEITACTVPHTPLVDIKLARINRNHLIIQNNIAPSHLCDQQGITWLMIEELDELNVDSKSLRIFLAVHELQSVTRAAEFLGVTQSTVSYNIDQLRTTFDDPLFSKSGRGIESTARTIELAPKVRLVLADLEGLLEPDQFDPESSQQAIRIAANVLETMPLLKALQTNLWHQFPNLDFVFPEIASRDNVEMFLSNGVADVVISVRLNPHPAILGRCELERSPVVIYYDPAFRAPVTTVSEFAAANHAVLEFGGTKPSSVELYLNELGLSRTVKLGAPNVAALAALIKGTDLIATMQSNLATHAFRDLACCPSPLPFSEVVFDLIWHRRDTNSYRNVWIRNQILQALGDDQHLQTLQK